MPETNGEKMEETSQTPYSASNDDRGAEVWEQASSTWHRAIDFLAREAADRPLRTTLLTLGMGYVVGGGLFSPLTARLFGTSLKVGLRVLALPAIAKGAVELGRQLVQDRDDADPRGPHYD